MCGRGNYLSKERPENSPISEHLPLKSLESLNEIFHVSHWSEQIANAYVVILYLCQLIFYYFKFVLFIIIITSAKLQRNNDMKEKKASSIKKIRQLSIESGRSDA